MIVVILKVAFVLKNLIATHDQLSSLEPIQIIQAIQGEVRCRPPYVGDSTYARRSFKGGYVAGFLDLAFIFFVDYYTWYIIYVIIYVCIVVRTYIRFFFHTESYMYRM